MYYTYLENNFSKIVLILFFGLMISCNGVHNEPPAEIIRTSGAGPSSRSAAAATTNDQAQETSSQQIILDSSGNPVNTN
jgi:hypothetical protein